MLYTGVLMSCGKNTMGLWRTYIQGGICLMNFIKAVCFAEFMKDRKSFVITIAINSNDAISFYFACRALDSGHTHACNSC